MLWSVEQGLSDAQLSAKVTFEVRARHASNASNAQSPLAVRSADVNEQVSFLPALCKCNHEQPMRRMDG